ncbi:polysaccharide deacetylase family protein [Hahella ganghwensis]|uniref:polysaccharide deacetylase family protein n=1 Tax=Hahella ganghwensis TaxID=286420 RepID=UPI0003A6246C|nr:polysaccharide deacetylase family protein [Hahella ganghwensis]
MLKRMLKALVIALVGVMIVGCQSRIPGISMPINTLEVYDYSRDYLIIKSQEKDSFEAISARYYGDASQSFRIKELNPTLEAEGEQLVVLPLRNINPTGVYPGYYKTIPILCYHQFTEASSSSHPLVLRERKFRRQMQYLKDNGYQVLGLDDLDDYFTGKKPIPDKSVVLTIDDGYRSIYDVAYPVLKEFGYPATVFLYTDFVGGGAALSWNQIKELQSSDLITFQPHSKSHTSLATLDDPDQAKVDFIRAEVAEPKAVLQSRIGVSSRHFAYPYGDSSLTAVSVLEEEGYQRAYTVQAGGNPTFSDPMRMRRAMIYDSDSLSIFKLKLTTREKFRQ